MKKLVQSLSYVAIVLALGAPLTAAAEARGTAPCAGLSWNALASGECSLDSAVAVVVREPRQAQSAETTQLLTLETMVPEPETYLLMLLGLAVVAGVSRRLRRG